jgi:hypothetical protein
MGAGKAVLPGGFQVETAEADRLDPRLKYDTTGKKPVVLIPQPSDDPNDPLVRLYNSSITRGKGGE